MSDRLHAFVTLVTVVTYPSSVTTGHLKSWQVSRLAPVAQSKSWACRLDFAARSNLQPGGGSEVHSTRNRDRCSLQISQKAKLTF
jgi:hypothetical protein